MDIIAKLNSATTVVSLRELETGKPYEIIEAEKVPSKFDGMQLKVKIRCNEDFYGTIYLPQRFAKSITDDKELEQLKGLKLMYYGMKKVNNRDTHDIRFIM